MKKVVCVLLLSGIIFAQEHSDGNMDTGKHLFKEYCWGCHHQTAEAFGPSFKTIANKRNKGEIMAQIVDPAATSAILGYKRSSMPSFSDLNATQIELLTTFILSFKDKK